jgi:cellulase/cellobiase CelA1
VLLIVVTSGLAITALAHAAAAAARLSVSSTWQTGFIAHFTIVNASTAPMTDWRLEFDLPAAESVSHTWSSTLVQYGTHYVLIPANWNRIIAPGFDHSDARRLCRLRDSVIVPARRAVQPKFDPH